MYKKVNDERFVGKTDYSATKLRECMQESRICGSSSAG